MIINKTVRTAKQQLEAKLEMHQNKLAQAEQAGDQAEVEKQKRMIDVYDSELEAMTFLNHPVNTGAL